MESTASLLALVRDGDESAKDRLFRRYLPILDRWATGRLPAGARDLVDTNDIVQVSLVRALNKVGEFEPRHEGAFLVYLRRILLNQIRDQARRVKRRPEPAPVSDDLADDGPSPLEDLARREILDRYDAALDELTEAQRQAVFLRLELGYTHREVAEALPDATTPDAARMLVARALVKLAESMGDVADDATRSGEGA
jgi:RNA polymerase sigma-70 factor (ECF subfamily)